MSENVMTPLPQYQCHKKVWALKIREIVPEHSMTMANEEAPKPDGALIYPVDEGYGAFTVSQAYLDKHNPEVGGYWVQYKDGYQSYSPAKAFEDGYTRI